MSCAFKSLGPCASLVLLVLLHSCARSVYNNEPYISTVDLRDKKVAIMPVDVEFTGRLPKGMTAAQKSLMEEKESENIQALIYREYLYRSRHSRKKQSGVEILDPTTVNSKLRQGKISLRESWKVSPDSVAQLAGADLVLRVWVKEDRIMSDAASLGIGVATTVLTAILNRGGASIGASGRTYNIFFDASLLDARSGVVISKISREGSANWSQTPESIIRNSSGKLIRRGAVYARQ